MSRFAWEIKVKGQLGVSPLRCFVVMIDVEIGEKWMKLLVPATVFALVNLSSNSTRTELTSDTWRKTEVSFESKSLQMWNISGG